MPALPFRVACLGVLLGLVPACAGVPTRIEAGYPVETTRALVIVVDGAGGYQTAPEGIAIAVGQTCAPLTVRSFDWTHGRGRWLADERDQAHSRCQAQRLAAEVCACRQAYPGICISLVAFSAGAAVALEGAAVLPPNSLDKIVLLAPAVSPNFDLRRPLASARRGIDAFTSDRDVLRLGLATLVVGTADGRYERGAGFAGFNPPVLSPAEACLAARFRQHPWDPCVAWTGNRGGHSGTLRVEFVKAYVLPLLVPPAGQPSLVNLNVRAE